MTFLTCLRLIAAVYLTTNTEPELPQESGKSFVRIMTVNCWAAGTVVDNGLKKLADHIIAQNVDIVGIQEFDTIYLSTMLNYLSQSGHNWAYGDRQSESIVFTKHSVVPLINPPSGSYTYLRTEVKIKDGQTIIVYNTHLDPSNYGPYVVCNRRLDSGYKDAMHQSGASRSTQIVRMRQDEQFRLDMNSNRPMIFMGDFNEPSHLDWVSRSASLHCGETFRWPTSSNLTSFDFIDAYRFIYPDPLTHPGTTWSPIYSDTQPIAAGSEPTQDALLPEPRDRIDFIYYRDNSAIKPQSCETYWGTKFLYNITEPLHTKNDWPSDHASVICNFLLSGSLPRPSDRGRPGEIGKMVRIMTVSMWLSGQNVLDGLRKTAEQINSQNVDIVGLQEINSGDLNDLTQRLSQSNQPWMHGYNNYDTVVFSKKKILSTLVSPLTTYAYTRSEVEINDGVSIIVWNIHLGSNDYGPYIACNKAFEAEYSRLINRNSAERYSKIFEMRRERQFQTDLDSNRPMIVLGNFNEPSHLDWIDQTSSLHCGKTFKWSASDYMSSYGFVDAYRSVYPNPLSHPGSTWSPIHSDSQPALTAREATQDVTLPEPKDRLDFIYYKSHTGIEPRSCRVFEGSTPLRFVTDPLHTSNDWPSDHSSVICDFFCELH